MAPPKKSQDEPMEEAGYQEFFDSLTEFATNRGITVDFQSRVNGKHIDLYKLYNLVTSRGGYDKVSSEKLAWRSVGTDFNLGAANAAAYAFALKTTYYKNLAAYEIKHMHSQEPPPVGILEKLTAKGADILSRTVDNFKPPAKRSNVVSGDGDSASEEERTLKEEKMDIDEPNSQGRTTRGLRQAPPQRVLFQPDLSSSRQVRHSSNHLQSPQPAPAVTAHTGYNYSASSDPKSIAFTIANYEPRQQASLSLRPLVTPGNNYPVFRDKLKQARDKKRRRLGLVSPSTPGMMKPGAGFEGPNIYVRTLQGLRSPLPAEQDYALHHLVKISHERGDKYKFEAFPGLGEGLVEYVLRVSSLFYDVKWEICYSEDEHEIYTLDGINGTPDIVQRIQCLRRIDTSDEMESEEYGRKITKIHEAGLTIRNLALLEENAAYLADMPQLRDFLSIALNLPNSPVITELKHYALDISECVTRYWKMDFSDPLYGSLLKQIEGGHDRGASLTALRALSRISMNLDDPNLLKQVPAVVLRRIFEWSLLEDEELVSACLEFLYQFTATRDNILYLLSNYVDLSLSSFLAQVARLLQYRASTSAVRIVASKAIPSAAATEIPGVPQDLLDQFLKYDEPDRSNHWLRSVFEEDLESDITQIALWHAYQDRFMEHATKKTPLLPAAEFIKNVSTIFTGAKAEVITGANHKFIIKGIRPRHAPMDTKGRVYSRCMWKSPGLKACGTFHLKPRYMFDHIVYSHLGIDRNQEGTWDFESNTRPEQRSSDCYWAGCRHYARTGADYPSTYDLGMHVKTHLPDISSKADLKQKNNRTPATQTATNGHLSNGNAMLDLEHGRNVQYKQTVYYNTAVDELGNATGLPLASVLVLRNVARNLPKAIALLEGDDREHVYKDWIEKLFGPLKERLIYVMAHNRPLAGYVSDVMSLVEKGMAL